MNDFIVEELPAAVRVAENTDVLEVIFEHCGLPCLRTLKRVCKPWCALAREMPTRWSTASIAGHLHLDLDERVEAQYAVHLQGGGGLAVTDIVNGRILVFSPSDLDAQTGGGTGACASRIIGCRGAAPGDFDMPAGLVADGTHLFVADCGNHRMQQLRISDGRSVDSIGELGIGHGQLRFPEGLALVRGSEYGGSSGAHLSDSELAVGSSDRLYVADRCNHRICVFGVSPLRYLTSISQQGSAPVEFYGPEGIAVHKGCLYVADLENKRVQVLTLGGGFVRSFDVDFPNSIAVRPDGRLLLKSRHGSRVELRTLHGSLLQVRFAKYTLGTVYS